MGFMGTMGRALKAPFKPAQKMMGAVPGVKKVAGTVPGMGNAFGKPSPGVGPSPGGFGGIMQKIQQAPPPAPNTFGQNNPNAFGGSNLRMMPPPPQNMMNRFGGQPAPEIQGPPQPPPMQPPSPEQMVSSPEQQDVSALNQQVMMSGMARPSVMPRFGGMGGRQMGQGGGMDQGNMMRNKLMQMMQQRRGGLGPSQQMMAQPMQQEDQQY